MKFPIFKTKIKNVSQSFNLSDPKERKDYFEIKAGPEIKKLKDYLKENTFIAYLLGKKNSGKGTYSKLFMEAIGSEHIAHISIGDIIRSIHQDFTDSSKRKEILDFLEKHYRGYISIDQAIKALKGRNTKILLPTEFILALVKREISKTKKKALFIDGFPRDLDQVSYSLFFRDLIGYRDDPDVFILINVPEVVITERMKWRVVCPKCQTPRNLKLMPTKEIDYNQKTGQFSLICDNPDCQGAHMVSKEGDELGIEVIKKRLEMDKNLMKQAFSLYGIPKILLRNSIPVESAGDSIDKYEITPEYSYQCDENSGKIKITEKPWVFNDDENIPSYSLLAPPIVVSLIKQVVDVFKL
jgi:adenylate kinase family enzyme